MTKLKLVLCGWNLNSWKLLLYCFNVNKNVSNTMIDLVEFHWWNISYSKTEQNVISFYQLSVYQQIWLWMDEPMPTLTKDLLWIEVVAIHDHRTVLVHEAITFCFKWESSCCFVHGCSFVECCGMRLQVVARRKTFNFIIYLYCW